MSGVKANWKNGEFPPKRFNSVFQTGQAPL